MRALGFNDLSLSNKRHNLKEEILMIYKTSKVNVITLALLALLSQGVLAIGGGIFGGLGSAGLGSAGHNSVKNWILVVDETFTDNSNGWTVGDYPTEQTPRFDLRVTDGRYRWDAKYTKSWQRPLYAPIGTVVSINVDIDISVDTKVIDFTPPAATSIIFGVTENRQYALTVSTNGKYNLSKKDGGNYAKKMIIGWSNFNKNYNPKNWNRLRVTVSGNVIKLYVNSALVGKYRENDYPGGKIGIGLNIFQEGIAVVDFDNFRVYKR
jgi:hypothetical protein